MTAALSTRVCCAIARIRVAISPRLPSHSFPSLKSMILSSIRQAPLAWAAAGIVAAAGCTDRRNDCQSRADCMDSGIGGGSLGGQTHSGGVDQAGAGAGASSDPGPDQGGLAGQAGESTTLPCNGACSAPTPVCSPSKNLCLECVTDAHCVADRPACSAAGNCVECTISSHCSGTKAVCKPDSNRCVECATNGDCATVTNRHVCDPATNQCVGCLQNADCASLRSSPFCLQAENTCVGCLENADCRNSAASYCSRLTNSCEACELDVDCAHIEGKGACSAGVCVQCSTSNDQACVLDGIGYSCNPKSNSCTQTRKHSVALCGACVADSECQSEGIVARCVPMTFGPNRVPRGNYCLRAVSSGCEQPFGSTLVMTLTAVSASGAPSDDYCGIDQGSVTCEAIRDMQDPSNSIRCTNPNTNLADDDLCGCSRNPVSGVCEGPGDGGLCREINGANRCTIQCGDGSQCTTGRGCTSKSPAYCG